jgi:hypothetical protein
MINYINNIDNISNIIFFQKLTDLLFKIDNNQLFIENCIQFFDSLIDLQTYYNKDLMDNINYNIGTKMYDGIGVLPGQNNFVNKLYNQYINNDKTRIWNNILTLIVDPNDSYPTFIMKSMMDDPIINIPDIYMKKILESTDGLINNNGILFDSLIDTVSFGLAPSLLIVYNIYTVLGITLAIFYFLSVIYRLTKFTVKLYELELEHKNKIVKTKRITGLPIQFAAIIVFLIFIASPYNYINMFLILGTTLLMHSSFKINKPHY